VALVGLLLRLNVVTDHLYHALVKDPPRVAPAGRVIVAPADGTVLYVHRVAAGVAPEVVKRGVRVPLTEHFKLPAERVPRDGWLVGIYMNTFGVHVNRVPNAGRVKERHVFNGPHMDMTAAETKIILTGLLPGLATLRKLLGLAPYAIEDDADFVLKSARETLVMEDERGVNLYVVRIADYYVGRILTWVREGQSVARGDKLGMISWGSQTDLFIEDTPGLAVTAEVGDYVYGGETVLARY
jgi:phosphatidylserine decarboxylase